MSKKSAVMEYSENLREGIIIPLELQIKFKVTIKRIESLTKTIITRRRGIIAISLKKEQNIIEIYNKFLEKRDIIRGHKANIHALSSLSPEILASGSNDWTIKLWGLRNREFLGTLTGGHSSTIWAITPIQGGQYIASGGDYSICVWDIIDQSLIQKLSLTGVITTLLSTGKHLVSGDTEGKVEVWNNIGLPEEQPKKVMEKKLSGPIWEIISGPEYEIIREEGKIPIIYYTHTIITTRDRNSGLYIYDLTNQSIYRDDDNNKNNFGHYSLDITTGPEHRVIVGEELGFIKIYTYPELHLINKEIRIHKSAIISLELISKYGQGVAVSVAKDNLLVITDLSCKFVKAYCQVGKYGIDEMVCLMY